MAALVVAGCSDSDSSPPADLTDDTTQATPVQIDLAGVTATPAAGSLNLGPGQTGDIGDISFMCASGGESCMVTVKEDGTAESTGGMVTAMDSAAYKLRMAQNQYNTELNMAKTAAEAAKNAAAEAATSARTHAVNAMGAVANRAAIQTSSLMDETAETYAMKAGTHADQAEAASAEAMEAYNDAMEATVIADAAMKQALAEGHQADAADHAMKAGEKETAAMTAAAMDVMIDHSGDHPVVSVGSASIMADGKLNADGGSGVRILPREPHMASTPQGQEITVSPRMLPLGMTYNTTGVRLDVVDSYESEMSVVAFKDTRDPDTGKLMTRLMTTEPNVISVKDQPALLTKAAGEYYKVGVRRDGYDNLADVGIRAGTEGEPLYFYHDGANMKYARLVESRMDAHGVTTWVYAMVDLAGRAMLPVSASYNHLSYGMWANKYAGALSPASDANHIAFVDAKGSGMTKVSEMPLRRGAATYTGQYIATVSTGGSALPMTRIDDAMLTARFGMGSFNEIEDNSVELVLTDVMKPGMTKLAGTIDGSMFSGDKAPMMSMMNEDSAMSAYTGMDYAGSFTGSFFGPGAPEAGGVFKYMSKGNEDTGVMPGAMGWFHGSFGAAR